jgi:hypothetical protein
MITEQILHHSKDSISSKVFDHSHEWKFFQLIVYSVNIYGSFTCTYSESL